MNTAIQYTTSKKRFAYHARHHRYREHLCRLCVLGIPDDRRVGLPEADLADRGGLLARGAAAPAARLLPDAGLQGGRRCASGGSESQTISLRCEM